jgi:outer membrane protein TolC
MQYESSLKYTDCSCPARASVIFRLEPFRTFFFTLVFIFLSFACHSQDSTSANGADYLTLRQCIDYALKHQPALNQSYLSKSIVKTTNAINLSGWFPQVSINGNLTHYNELPTVFLANGSTGGGPQLVKSGVVNTAIPQLTVTQAIFSPELLFASKSADLLIKQADQTTDSTKIELISAVSKSFYNLLLTIEQIEVLKEDTARLIKNLSDTYHQYKGGIVDETDYDEATITLNNSKAALKQATENVVPLYATLKQTMGFPPANQFNVSFDTVQMMRDIAFDTTQELKYEQRIEYKQLQTTKSLQHQITSYYRTAFLPSLSGLFNYNYEFQSNESYNLYANAYPYSYFGLTLSWPIFTGFSRVESIRRGKLQEQLLDWSTVSLKSEIYSEYTTSLANYKSNLFNLYAMEENEAMAKRTYAIVALQYNQGVVAYLNVITAESNLITSEIGYLNALFQLLSSKIDLQKAMGIITY